MAAGLSQRQKSDRTRRFLQRLADNEGGTYVPGDTRNQPYATGTTDDGLTWRATLEWGYMSNGESVGLARYTVTRDDIGESVMVTGQSSLGSLLNKVRAKRAGRLAYTVGGSMFPGAVYEVGAENVTADLGRARWAQQQTGNVANVYSVESLGGGRVRVIGEQPYTSRESLKAMDGFIGEHGLNIYDAQKTRYSNPALPVIAE